jgi:dUTP pyrophosphatase
MSLMSKIPVPVVVEEGDLLPSYATVHASGADARASIQEPKVIPPGSMAVIPTGVKAAVPPGYEIQVRPRSGFAVKHQVTVLNTPGTIDADYRGEICVILINHGKEPFTVLPKMRIAQFVLAPVCQAEFVFEELSTTQRGEGGFGHTGAH